MSKGNFKVIGTNNYTHPTIIKGKIYEFINGKTTWDCGSESCNYTDFADFQHRNPTVPVEEYKDTPTSESISITRHKNKVVATITDGENTYSQYIKLSDADGDFKKAAKMAAERVLDRFNPAKEASSFDWSAFKSGKFAVHCDTEEKSRAFMKECDEHGIKWADGNKASEKVSIHGFASDRCYNLNNLKYISVAYVDYYTKEGFTIIDYPFKPTVKEVHRPAKVGEWIKVVKAERSEDCYQNGAVYQVTRVHDDAEYGVYINTKKTQFACAIIGRIGSFIWTREYVVLENYTPEPEAPQPFKKAKVGDKIKIVKVAKNHQPKVKVGYILTVDCVRESYITTERNVFTDSDQEYIIVEKVDENQEALQKTPLSEYTDTEIFSEAAKRAEASK